MCGGGTHYSYSNVTVSISPQPQSVAAGSSTSFSTTVNNAPNFPVWTLNGSIVTSATSSAAGSFSTPTTDAPTGTYVAPATPPIYTDAQVGSGYKQGMVTLGAFVSNSSTNVLSDAFGSVTFAIVGPISAGISPTAARVNLGGILQFNAYVVGTLSNSYTLKVNGFTGGGSEVGTISATGLYTAPAVMPMTGSTVTITAVSNADTTKTATATVTLQ